MLSNPLHCLHILSFKQDWRTSLGMPLLSSTLPYCSRQTRPPGYGHQWLVLWNCYGGQWADADQCDLANVIPGFCMCPILSMSRVTPTECKLYVCQKFWKFTTFWLSSFATRYSFQPFFVFSVSHKTGMYCLIIVMTLLAAVFPAWEPW